MLTSYEVYKNSTVFLNWYEKASKNENKNQDIVQNTMQNVLEKPELLTAEKRTTAYWNLAYKNKELNWIKNYNNCNDDIDDYELEFEVIDTDLCLQGLYGLNEKELEFLRLFVAGYKPSEIAELWQVSKAYVSKVWRSIKEQAVNNIDGMFQGFNKVEIAMINRLAKLEVLEC